MKTLEERAKEAGTISQYKSDYRYDKKSVEYGYTQGAYEQKAIDIEKACDILSDLGVFDWMADDAQEGFSPEVYKDQFVKCLIDE